MSEYYNLSFASGMVPVLRNIRVTGPPLALPVAVGGKCTSWKGNGTLQLVGGVERGQLHSTFHMQKKIFYS